LSKFDVPAKLLFYTKYSMDQNKKRKGYQPLSQCRFEEIWVSNFKSPGNEV